jgi:hypothetical protein
MAATSPITVPSTSSSSSSSSSILQQMNTPSGQLVIMPQAVGDTPQTLYVVGRKWLLLLLES